jgi:hypothetical protein
VSEPVASAAPDDDGLEAWAAAHPLRACGGLLAVFLLLRLAFLAVAGRALGGNPLNLALLGDGHLYILIARTFPHPYVGGSAILPALTDDAYLTAWFPFYPFLIWLTGLVVGDLRAAALLVSLAAGGVTLFAVRALARETGGRPFAAAALFVVLPPAWLLVSSLALVEPLFVALFSGAVWATLRSRFGLAAGLTAAALVTQKSAAVLLPLVLLVLELRRHRLRRLRRLWPFLLAPLPLVALQVYLGVACGDPLVNLRAQSQVFTSGGQRLLALPGTALAQGLLTGEPVYRAAAPWVAAALVFALLGLWAAVRTQEARPFAVWLGAILLFHLALAGPWAYLGLPRFLTLAGPAAVCAVAAWPRLRLTAGRLAALAAVAVPAVFVADLRQLDQWVEIMARFWPRRYFELFLRHVIG